MDVVTIITELRRELQRVDGLILALESLQSGKRRGRPPKALQALKDGVGPDSSPATKRAAEAVKKATAKRSSKSKPSAAKR
jgi:hypothetical protein